MLTSQREDAVVYRGDGEKFARRLSKVIHGGQVVLSEIAWASIQDQIPGQSQVITALHRICTKHALNTILELHLICTKHATFMAVKLSQARQLGHPLIQDQVLRQAQVTCLCMHAVVKTHETIMVVKVC